MNPLSVGTILFYYHYLFAASIHATPTVYQNEWNLLKIIEDKYKIGLTATDTDFFLNFTSKDYKFQFPAQTIFPKLLIAHDSFFYIRLTPTTSSFTILTIRDPNDTVRLQMRSYEKRGHFNQIRFNIFYNPLKQPSTSVYEKQVELTLPFHNSLWTLGILIEQRKITIYTSCDDINHPLGYHQSVNTAPIEVEFFHPGATLFLLSNGENIGNREKFEGTLSDFLLTTRAYMKDLMCHKNEVFEGSGTESKMWKPKGHGNYLITEKEISTTIIPTTTKIPTTTSIPTTTTTTPKPTTTTTTPKPTTTTTTPKLTTTTTTPKPTTTTTPPKPTTTTTTSKPTTTTTTSKPTTTTTTPKPTTTTTTPKPTTTTTTPKPTTTTPKATTTTTTPKPTTTTPKATTTTTTPKPTTTTTTPKPTTTTTTPKPTTTTTTTKPTTTTTTPKPTTTTTTQKQTTTTTTKPTTTTTTIKPTTTTTTTTTTIKPTTTTTTIKSSTTTEPTTIITKLYSLSKKEKSSNGRLKDCDLKGEKNKKGDIGKVNESRFEDLEGLCRQFVNTKMDREKRGGQKGQKGKEGPKGSPGPVGQNGTCTLNQCLSVSLIKGEKGEQGVNGYCSTERCEMMFANSKGEKGTEGVKGEKGDQGSFVKTSDIIKILQAEMKKTIDSYVRKMITENKGSAGSCNCRLNNIKRERKLKTQTIVLNDAKELKLLSTNYQVGQMVFIVLENVLLVKIDEGKNSWRPVKLGNSASDWHVYSERTLSPLFSQTVVDEVKLMLIALPKPTPGDLRSDPYEPGAHSGSSYLCQKQAYNYGLGRSFYPLLNTDNFDMSYILPEKYRYNVPIVNRRNERLAASFADLIRPDVEIQSNILNFRGDPIISDSHFPCVWIGQKPDLHADRSENDGLCLNWMSNKSDKTAKITVLQLNKPLLDQTQIKESRCDQLCYILCMQIYPVTS